MRAALHALLLAAGAACAAGKVVGPDAGRTAAVAVGATGDQLPTAAHEPPPTAVGSGDDAASAGDDDWPVYPDGEPRAGEPIMPVVLADVTDPAIVEAAAWAVGHLRNLSDSGVYTSLSLAAILDAATQEGVYHNNTLLTLELASPHLLDGVPTSVHRVVVMADLEDGVRSFAIDAFPIMEPDAIEEFWTRKVDAHRARREAELAALDAEYEQYYDEICAEEEARQGMQASLGTGPDGKPVTAQPPRPVASDADDDAPPPLDLGLDGAIDVRVAKG